MKKLILAFIALAFAFAISSCCDQSRCPENLRCPERIEKSRGGNQEEPPYRWDQPSQKVSSVQPERQHRRW